MSSGTPYIGSKISLVSKAEIRYEGFLYTIDQNDSTVTLAKVISLGTEDRVPGAGAVPAREEVFEYIVFRGSDIKDLHVCEGPKKVEDPAIVTHSYSQSYGGGPNYHRGPPPPFPPPQGGLPQFGYNPFNMPQQNVPVEMGGHPNNRGPTPPNVPRSEQQRGGGGGGANKGQGGAPFQDNRGKSKEGGKYREDGYSRENRESSGSKQGKDAREGSRDAGNRDNRDGYRDNRNRDNRDNRDNRSSRGGHRGDQKNARDGYRDNCDNENETGGGGFYDNNNMHKNRDQRDNRDNRDRYNRDNRRDNNKEYRDNRNRDNRDAGNRDNRVKRDNREQEEEQQRSGSESSRGGQSRGGPRGGGNRGAPRGGAGGNRRGGAPRGGAANGGAAPATAAPTIKKFTEDFDFETANAKFNKEEIEKELLKVLKKVKIKDEDGSEEIKDIENEEREADERAPLPSPDKFYDRSKSFFDNILCEAMPPRSEEEVMTRRQEQALNTETFGSSAAHYRPAYRGRGRGRGRWRGGRGFHRGGRGRGNFNSNRRWVDYEFDYEAAGIKSKNQPKTSED